jgi:hypothetical protein
MKPDERGWIQVDDDNLQVCGDKDGIRMRVVNGVNGSYLQKFFPDAVVDDLINTLIELRKET